jgi:hypothetical protein
MARPDVGMDIRGLRKLQKTLKRMSDADKKELRKAAKRETREAMRPLHRAARANAPVETGRLRKAVKLRAWKRPEPGEVGIKVVVNPGRGRDDPRGAYYGMMVEQGYIANGTYVPGRYYLKRAYEAHHAGALRDLSGRLSKTIDQVAKG